MNPAEAVALCRLVKACCPQQAFDEFTADAYHDLLGDLRATDCRPAVTELGKRQVFIAPAEIRAEVRRIRDRRILEHPPLSPPDGLDDAGYREWFVSTRRTIADGGFVPEPEPKELVARTMPDLSKVLPKMDPLTQRERDAAAETIAREREDYRHRLEAARAELEPLRAQAAAAVVAGHEPEREQMATAQAELAAGREGEAVGDE